MYIMKFNVTIILLLSLLFIISCGKSYSGKKQPVALKGVLDLRNWDFEKDGPVELKGQAELYWHTLLNPENNTIEKASEMSCYMDIPGIWTGEICNKKKIGKYGYGTIRLIILLNKKEDVMAFKIKGNYSAKKLTSQQTVVFLNYINTNPVNVNNQSFRLVRNPSWFNRNC